MKTMTVQATLAITWNPSNIIKDKNSGKYQYTDIPTTNGYQLVFTDTEFGNVICKGDIVVEYRGDDGIGELVKIESEYCIASYMQKKVIVEQNQINKADIIRIIEEFNDGIIYDVMIEMNEVYCKEVYCKDVTDCIIGYEIYVNDIITETTETFFSIKEQIEQIEKYIKPKLIDGYVTLQNKKKEFWNREELIKILMDYDRDVYFIGGNIENKIIRYLRIKNI